MLAVSRGSLLMGSTGKSAIVANKTRSQIFTEYAKRPQIYTDYSQPNVDEKIPKANKTREDTNGKEEKIGA